MEILFYRITLSQCLHQRKKNINDIFAIPLKLFTYFPDTSACASLASAYNNNITHEYSWIQLEFSTAERTISYLSHTRMHACVYIWQWLRLVITKFSHSNVCRLKFLDKSHYISESSVRVSHRNIMITIITIIIAIVIIIIIIIFSRTQHSIIFVIFTFLEPTGNNNNEPLLRKIIKCQKNPGKKLRLICIQIHLLHI